MAKCCVDGCDRDELYKTDHLCQMHYFRRMRNGTFDLVRARKYRTVNPAGYHKLFEPSHVLCDSSGYVYEHRKVLFDIQGFDLRECELCGAEWSWNAIYHSHVDHINNDKSDNRPENLRPLCNSCNTSRSKPEMHTVSGKIAVTHNGVTMTPEEWSRADGVNVTGKTIANRIRAGMSHSEAIFSEKKTHKQKS